MSTVVDENGPAVSSLSRDGVVKPGLFVKVSNGIVVMSVVPTSGLEASRLFSYVLVVGLLVATPFSVGAEPDDWLNVLSLMSEIAVVPASVSVGA